MKFLYAFLFVIASAVVFAADFDKDDHSKHCHIDGYPTIHVNIGDHFLLPGACLKLYCKQNDLFEVINTCDTVPNSKENVNFADSLLKGQICPK